jgi:hypothetical protein
MPRESILSAFDEKNLPGLRNELQRLWDAVEQLQAAPEMQSGGTVPKTGLYKLHEGETVLPKGTSIGDIHIHREDDFIKYFLLMGS